MACQTAVCKRFEITAVRVAQVAAAANALNANLSMGWKQLGKSYDYLKAQTARVPGSPGGTDTALIVEYLGPL